MTTDNSVCAPVVTAGSACGALNPGRFIDYRKGGGPNVPTNNSALGLLYSHFLGSVAVTMGMPKNEFERWEYAGIGYPFLPSDWPLPTCLPQGCGPAWYWYSQSSSCRR